ncbi:MAG: dephospho-CoA kinase [Acidobacteriota bacterium]|nr:dephospho-CoA kinase [Acidobacteriota bacterium]MDH3784904.1 dephospho-CoA kinase [Acidobacteriota bacterium]
MPLLVAGLTGGIATGKSTVGQWLSELGAYVVDADRLAHEAMAPTGPAYDGVVTEFGQEILAADLTIDRTKLAADVFGNPAHLQRLNALVHPHVRDAASRRFFAQVQKDPHSIGVFEAALLVETGAHRDMDRLIVTHCRRETQIERMLARGLDREEAGFRLSAQLPHNSKIELADFAIDTDRGREETRESVREIWASLRGEALGS